MFTKLLVKLAEHLAPGEKQIVEKNTAEGDWICK